MKILTTMIAVLVSSLSVWATEFKLGEMSNMRTRLGDPGYIQMYLSSTSPVPPVVDYLIAWWPFSSVTNANNAYDDATTNNFDLYVGSGAALPTRYASSNGIGNNVRFDSGDWATSTIPQTVYGMSWWGRSNDQNLAYYSVMGGTQTINGVVGTWSKPYWGDWSDWQGTSTNTYWVDPYESYKIIHYNFERTKENGSIAGYTDTRDIRGYLKNATCGTAASGKRPSFNSLYTNSSGRVETVMSTDGGDYFAANYSNSTSTVPSNCTYTLWFKSVSSTAYNVGCYLWSVSNTRNLSFYQYKFQCYNGSVWQPLDSTFTTYTNGSWSFLAVVFSGTNVICYRDGTMTTNLAYTWTSMKISTTVGEAMAVLSYSDTVQGFLPNGTMIDDFIIWSTNLPLSAITNRMAHTHPMTNTELRTDNDYTLGNGSTAAFGDPKVWTSYGDPATNFYGQATNWGWGFAGGDKSLWSNCTAELNFDYSVGAYNIPDTSPLTTNQWGKSANVTWKSNGTNGWYNFSPSSLIGEVTNSATGYYDNPRHDWTGPGHSISVWVRPEAVNNNRTFFSKEYALNVGDTGRGWWCFLSASRYWYWVVGNGSTQAYITYDATTITANIWYHYVGVWESDGTMSLYLNAVKRGTPTGTPYTNDVSTTQVVCLGQDGRVGDTYNYFDGDIDDAMIFDVPLTATQVTNLYNFGVGRHP